MNFNAWSPESIDFPASYVFAAGTSMASPKAAAVAALIIHENPDLQRGEVREVLRATAEELDGSNVDAFFGHGMVNAYRTLGGQ